MADITPTPKTTVGGRIRNKSVCGTQQNGRLRKINNQSLNTSMNNKKRGVKSNSFINIDDKENIN